MTKIVTLQLNTADIDNYKKSIRAIIATHRREDKPFILIAQYEDEPDDREHIPLAIKLTAILRVMAVASHSQWTGQMVAINPPQDTHWLIRFAMQIWGQDWQIKIAPDMQTAEQIVGDWLKSVRR